MTTPSPARLVTALAIGALVAVGVPKLVPAAPDPGPTAVHATGTAPLAIGLQKQSRLWLEGKSTVHAFHSEATRIELTLARDSALAEPANAEAFERMVRAGDVRGLALSIPVDAMHSGKDGLDKNMRKALKADANPTIRFRLARYRAETMADSMAIEAQGALTVAGVEQTIDLHAVARPAAEGLVLTGSVPLRMTQFGIKPPTMMLGTLRTDDQVVIHYRLVLAVQAAAATNQEGESR